MMRKVDPVDAFLHTAVLPNEDYLHALILNGIINDDDVTNSEFILFRGPYVESGDRVGKRSLVDVMFPAAECRVVVQTAHAKVNLPVEGDDSPGPSWHYTLAIFPKGIVFDNRVFSEHDEVINRFKSMPDKKKVKELDDEKVLIFHDMWRIAIKGTATLLEEEEKVSLVERMRKRRAAPNP